MSAAPIRALVLTGDGINCEEETAQALRAAGFQAEIRHLNDLISERMSPDSLAQEYAALAIPGGFSFGDDLSSGKVLALKIQHGLKWNLPVYAERGGLIIGICNGFQALIRLGVFSKEISITNNVQGKFLNTWARVIPRPSRSIWLKGLGTLDLPIRHGEGRIIFSKTSKVETLSKFHRLGMICLTYETNPNGSEESIAGLCDPSGRILGLMPHPEAYLRWTSNPEWTLAPSRAGSPGYGLKLFENAFFEARASR